MNCKELDVFTITTHTYKGTGAQLIQELRFFQENNNTAHSRPRSFNRSPSGCIPKVLTFSHISSVQSLAPSLLDTSKLVITNPRMSKAHSNSSFLSKERDKSSVYLYVISLWQGARNRPLFLCNKFLR